VMAAFGDGRAPIAAAVAEHALARIAGGWAGSEPDRPAIALGALMAGWAIDRTGLGFHHALAQTAVRAASVGHAEANAALLPATVRATRARRPDEFDRLDAALGVPLESIADRLRERAGATLSQLAADHELLDRVVEAAAQRPELARIPPPLDRQEIERIYCLAAGSA
jgi:maleylacetate reductase